MAVTTEKEVVPMKVINNTDVPKATKVNWKHLSLVVLHFVVFTLSTLSGEFVVKDVAAGALP